MSYIFSNHLRLSLPESGKSSHVSLRYTANTEHIFGSTIEIL